MGLPNCVPEFYRSMQEAMDHKYQLHMEELEEVEGMEMVSEFWVVTVCDLHECEHRRIVHGDAREEVETEYYCASKEGCPYETKKEQCVK